MRKVIALVLAVSAMLAASIAAAAPGEPAVALAVNPPVGWFTGGSVAGTVAVGLARHHAIRINAASYAHRLGGADLIVGEASYSGRITDFSIGWQFFPRSLWDGFSIEAELLHRGRDTQVIEDFAASRPDLATDTSTLAARAHVAWTWRFENVFFAAGVGLSYGYETGTETDISSYDASEWMTSSVARTDLAAEGFLRLGMVFDR